MEQGVKDWEFNRIPRILHLFYQWYLWKILLSNFATFEEELSLFKE